MRLVFHRFVEDLTVENLIKQVAYYMVWALGLVVAADALGFEPQTVITGLGLTGLALGFALKDIISNFVSGVMILVLRPFELGDQIVVGETEGGVERIELCDTDQNLRWPSGAGRLTHVAQISFPRHRTSGRQSWPR